MRRLVLLLAALPLAASAQRAVAFSDPVAESDTPPHVCVAHESERVCRAVEDDGAGVVIVTRDGAEVVRWTGSAPGVSRDVRAYRVGLGDGRSVLAVAVLGGVSNGLGVATWSIHVVPDGADEPTYGFVARDVDPEGGSFATWEGRPVVWATEWLDGEDPSGQGGPGLYLVGRPFFLGADGLEPAADLPIRARRLLYDFRPEAGGPVGWLSDRRAETRRRDPTGVEAPRGASGQITDVAPGPHGFRVTWADGAAERAFVVDPWSPPDDAGVARLGDRTTGRLFPLGYRPADLDGRPALVGDGPDGTHVLWLD